MIPKVNSFTGSKLSKAGDSNWMANIAKRSFFGIVSDIVLLFFMRLKPLLHSVLDEGRQRRRSMTAKLFLEEGPL